MLYIVYIIQWHTITLVLLRIRQNLLVNRKFTAQSNHSRSIISYHMSACFFAVDFQVLPSKTRAALDVFNSRPDGNGSCTYVCMCVCRLYDMCASHAILVRPHFFLSQLRLCQVERDRGITVKAQTASMLHDGHLLNLIDTPGHVDFSYEVRKAGHFCCAVIHVCMPRTLTGCCLICCLQVHIIPGFYR